jgi:hypothetical protein
MHLKLSYFIWLLFGVSCSLSAARFVFTASNPGAIAGTGRDLQFDIQGVPAEIRAARLQLRLNYSAARELGMKLVEVPGAIELPLIPDGTGTGPSYAGQYVISDSAVTTMQQLRPSSGVVPNVASRAHQFGVGGVCLNLIGRFLEFDRNRNGPLTLSITRTPSVGGGGAGSITEAVLVIDTAEPDEVLSTGFEEPAEAITRCRRPPLDLVFNGGVEGNQSPLAILGFTSQTPSLMTWSVQQLSPLQAFGPVQIGTRRTPVYAGRFGGRSRLNFGFWDEVTGTLNFTTGAGGRSLELPGDWVTTQHQVIPGDYDGDGVTDLAVAFFANGLWTARILFSKSGKLTDQIIDPRALDPQSFSSSRVGFGTAQDSDFDGRDEIFIHARQNDVSLFMRQIQFVPSTPNSFAGGNVLPPWGIDGDKLVLGRWSTSTSGNRLGIMLARKNFATNAWEWYRFPNETPVVWGLALSDDPVSIDVDGDGQNDIAVYRRTDQRWYVIQSSDGAQVTLGSFGSTNGLPLGTAQGIVAPPEF